jgi:UDP-glucose 4-epimerase
MQTRCFAYVGDIVPALVRLMECPEAEGQAVNLGSTEEVTIQELAELVVDLAGCNSPIRLVPYEEVYEANFEDMPRRVPDISKARRLIGFEPSTSLKEIVREMIEDRSRT